MLLDAHGDAMLTQGGGSADEEAEQMHGVLPFDLALVAEVLLNLLELAQCIPVEGLEDHLREEALANAQQLVGDGCGLLDERRVEAFQDVWVRPQGHDDELLQLPVTRLRGVVLELLGRPEERPLQLGRSEVNATEAVSDVSVSNP